MRLAPRWEPLGDEKGIPPRTRISPDPTAAKAIPPPKGKGKGGGTGSASQDLRRDRKEKRKEQPKALLLNLQQMERLERKENPPRKDRSRPQLVKTQSVPTKDHQRYLRNGKTNLVNSGCGS